MKKVLALVLAVMMVATVGFGAMYQSTIAPNSSIDVNNQTGISEGADVVTVEGTGTGANGVDAVRITYNRSTSYDAESQSVKWQDSGIGKETEGIAFPAASKLPDKIKAIISNMATPSASLSSLKASDYISSAEDVVFRSINTDNYSVSSVRYVTGKNLIKGVTIKDKDEKVAVEFVDDLNNTTAKSFALNYTLRGKGKMVIKNDEEAIRYFLYTGKDVDVGERVTIPSVKFTMTGSVGYGKVTVSLGDDGDQDLDGLGSLGIDREKDVVKFKRDANNDIGYTTRQAVAGAYTADAILTEEYAEMLTLEARVYSGDELFFDVDYAPDREVIGTLADVNADMDFFSFTSQKDFITFNSTARLIFNDAEEDSHVYKIVNKKLQPIGEFDEDEGCWVVKERTLGTYVVSDVALDQYLDVVGTDDIANPDTGANDVVGIAAALAAVALVSAAAVSLKK